jgi:serine/threonine protein kinase
MAEAAPPVTMIATPPPPPAAGSNHDDMFCILDEVQADIARDALQNFAILSAKEEKKKGRILRASKALQRLLNYDLDTPFPQDISVFWGPSTAKDSIQQVKRSIKENLTFSGDMLCYKHSGQTFWAEVSIQPIYVNPSSPKGGTCCMACFIRDISELRSEQHRALVGETLFVELREDHQEQTRVVKQALMNTMIVEPNKSSSHHSFKFTRVGEGPGVSALTGFDMGELHACDMGDLYGPGTTESDRRLLERAMQDHEPLSCDIMCYNKDGRPWWRHMLAIPIVCGAFLTFNVNVTRKNRYVGHYLIGHNIGRGSFGTVKLGKHKQTGKVVAIKRINDVSDPRTRKLVDLEIELQSRLKTDLTCQLHEVLKVENMVFMVMDHCAGGSVFDKLVSKGGVDEPTARPLFTQLVQAVQFCHDNRIVHRDLKPENVLLDETLTKITLIDFGLATYFVPGQHLKEVCGSKRFQAPEVMNRATSRGAPGYLAQPIDVWSLAVILFELVHGQIRLSQSDSNSTADFIEKYCARQSARGSFSQGLCDLLRKMLIVDPKKRISTPEILAHPWLSVDAATIAPTIVTHPSLKGAFSGVDGGPEPGFRSGTDGNAIQGESDWEGVKAEGAKQLTSLRRKLGKDKQPSVVCGKLVSPGKRSK